MLKIGLTGGIGSGKTTVANYFAKLGIDVIDADVIAREITRPNSSALKKIIRRFGDNIIDKKGKLKRKALAKIIFKNPKERLWLENLLHPLIYKKMLQKIRIYQAQTGFQSLALIDSSSLIGTRSARDCRGTLSVPNLGICEHRSEERNCAYNQNAKNISKSSYCILVLPLLFETKISEFRKLVDRVLVVDAPIKKCLARITKRDRIKYSTATKIIHAQVTRQKRLEFADDVIKNNGSLIELKKQVLKMHSKYNKLGNLM